MQTLANENNNLDLIKVFCKYLENPNKLVKKDGKQQEVSIEFLELFTIAILNSVILFINKNKLFKNLLIKEKF